MAANIPQIGTGKWGIVSGSASFEDQNDPFSKLSNIGNGDNVNKNYMMNPKQIIPIPQNLT